MNILKEIKNWSVELSLAAAALAAVYSALSMAVLPAWLKERFGSVSMEQLTFFAINPVAGADPAIKSSFVKAIITDPLIISAILVLPGIITYIILRIFGLHRTDEEIAGQIPPDSHARGLLLFLLAFALCGAAAYPAFEKGIEPVKFYNKTPSDNVMSDPRFLIAHAGGAIGKYPYTNSSEGINNAIISGFTMLELDLEMTSDGHIAAAHDWNYYRGMTGNEKNGSPMSLEEFKTQKIYGKYTPVDGFAIRNFFERNKNAVLITDKIKDFSAITQNFSFKERLIVEVFSYSDYQKALESGILYPALSLNALGKVEPQKILKNNIRMATVSDVFLEKYSEEIKLLHKRGITIMLYAPTKIINNPDYLIKVLGKSVSMAYVDYCAPKNPECHR